MPKELMVMQADQEINYNGMDVRIAGQYIDQADFLSVSSVQHADRYQLLAPALSCTVSMRRVLNSIMLMDHYSEPDICTGYCADSPK